MSKETPINRAIRIAGGINQLSKMIGDSKQAIWNWTDRGSVPANRCVAIELATGVDRRELRPDDWRDYWPEVVTAATKQKARRFVKESA